MPLGPLYGKADIFQEIYIKICKQIKIPFAEVLVKAEIEFFDLLRIEFVIRYAHVYGLVFAELLDQQVVAEMSTDDRVVSVDD